ncbi:MAG TPA: response regulator [Polyangia bacterium]|jgi:two-component system response regulator MprA|nr:response regulator [Polyangia bacterium]
MKRVLLVDDDADTRDLYARYLDDEGYDVSVASDGAEAVEVATTTQPDAIVMDVSMPGLDGTKAASRLRSGATTASIPIVAMSAEEPGSYETSSFDSTVEKPCTPPQLAELLDELTTRERTLDEDDDAELVAALVIPTATGDDDGKS